MPADHLTTARPLAPHAERVPAELATAVLAVLAGADLDTTAADHALDPADLSDAVRAYHAAGLAALQRRTEGSWYQVRVQFADWPAAEQAGATKLGPALDRLRTDESLARWWFLRKHPCWRLRLLHADTAAVNRVLDELTETGVIEQWWPTLYEPETAAFGGPPGMDTVHDLFCADSTGVLDYLRLATPGLGRRELSLVLLNGLLRAAGLDTFEAGDVFHRVAQLRPMPTDADTARISTLATNVRTLLTIPDLATRDLFTSAGPAAHAAPWLAAFQAAGEQLGHAAANGRLDRGLRAILTHAIIFHWNRFGISATSQAILTHAATIALLPPS